MTKLEELNKAWVEAHKVWSEALVTRREASEAYNEACVKADKAYTDLKEFRRILCLIT